MFYKHTLFIYHVKKYKTQAIFNFFYLQPEPSSTWQTLTTSLKTIPEVDNATTFRTELDHHSCFLVMEYVPGPEYTAAKASDMLALGGGGWLGEELGRLLALDLVLGNPDRFCVEELKWRGNVRNLIWGTKVCDG